MSLSFMTIPRLLRSSDQGFQFLHMLAFHCAGIRYLLHILNDDLINLCASAFWLLWWGRFGASAFWFLFGLFCFLPAWGVCSLVYPDTFLFLLFGSRDRRRILSFFLLLLFFSDQNFNLLPHHWFYLLFCFPCLRDPPSYWSLRWDPFMKQKSICKAK